MLYRLFVCRSGIWWWVDKNGRGVEGFFSDFFVLTAFQSHRKGLLIRESESVATKTEGQGRALKIQCLLTRGPWWILVSSRSFLWCQPEEMIDTTHRGRGSLTFCTCPVVHTLAKLPLHIWYSFNTSTNAQERVAQGCALNLTQNLLRRELSTCDWLW